MIIRNDMELTPVELIEGIFFKREDYYKPYSNFNSLSGTKLRAMIMLYDELKISDNPPSGLITYSSVFSPQSIIVAKVCLENNIPCIICVGVNTKNNSDFINRHKSLIIAKSLNADIRSIASVGYNNVLESRSNEIAESTGFKMVHFGINLDEYKNVILNSISNQVRNLPENLDNLIIPCGSGVTAGGILVGLKLYNKKVKRIIIIQISGYDRSNQINKILDLFDINIQYEFYVDKTYKYHEQIIQFIKPGHQLNVIYEAKAFKYFMKNRDVLGITKNDRTLFYIIAENNFLYK